LKFFYTTEKLLNCWSPGFTPRFLVVSVLLIFLVFCCIFILFVFVLCLVPPTLAIFQLYHGVQYTCLSIIIIPPQMYDRENWSRRGKSRRDIIIVVHHSFALRFNLNYIEYQCFFWTAQSVSTSSLNKVCFLLQSFRWSKCTIEKTEAEGVNQEGTILRHMEHWTQERL
jgi:hypothetical protein